MEPNVMSPLNVGPVGLPGVTSFIVPEHVTLNSRIKRDGQHHQPPPAPSQSYGPPQQNYGPPQQNHGPPQQNYGPPQQNHGPPQQNYGPPQQNYGPPQQNYGPPQNDFPGPLGYEEPLPYDAYDPDYEQRDIGATIFDIISAAAFITKLGGLVAIVAGLTFGRKKRSVFDSFNNGDISQLNDEVRKTMFQVISFSSSF